MNVALSFMFKHDELAWQLKENRNSLTSFFSENLKCSQSKNNDEGIL